jgi:hypothetical protein
MEDKTKPAATSETKERDRDVQARQKLARPPKEKTKVTIGPTDRSGPDVVFNEK